MKKGNTIISFFLILAVSFFLTGCEFEQSENIHTAKNSNEVTNVHFIDVDQGDSIFIELANGQTVLIDGGSRTQSDKVVDYIKERGVNKINYLIATHPHEDHIGGLPNVVKNFNIDNIYMPDITANTKIFEELLNEIEKKNMGIDILKGGTKIYEDEDISLLVLAPNSDNYEEINNYSIVIKLIFKDVSFIFTGDAEKISENEMIEKGYDLTADVLKIGHHGGRTSTTEKFLTSINPEYAVISAGKDNPYNHPHKETTDRLNKKGITVLRTDDLGDIVFSTDGENLNINNDSVKQGSNRKYLEEEGYYIGNKNTKVFHFSNCKSLPKEENRVIFRTKEEAIKNGYKPHEKCIN